MYMRKTVLFLTFLFCINILIISIPRAKEKSCKIQKIYDRLTTKNYLNELTDIEIKNIERICTNNICNYLLDKNIKRFIINHEEEVVDSIKDEDKKIESSLKGVKIDKIYFTSCT